MISVSIEEQIICFANKFFSKNGNSQLSEKSFADIIDSLRRYGPDKVQRFKSWVEMFE